MILSPQYSHQNQVLFSSTAWQQNLSIIVILNKWFPKLYGGFFWGVGGDLIT